MNVGKRQFLKAASAVFAAGTAGALADDRSPDETPSPLTTSPAPEGVDADTLREAEKLLGIPMSDREREQIIESIGAQLEDVKALRALEIGNGGAAPALTFDPRLPGVALPADRWRTSGRDAGARPDSKLDVAFAPVWRQARWLRAGDLSSRELTDIYVERIGRLDPRLECMVTVTADLARRQADEADREIAAGRSRGPLHGIPYGAKDLFDTAGVATTWGAAPYQRRIVAGNARVVERLEAAGAVLLGKTTLGALAYGDLWYGRPDPQPLEPRRRRERLERRLRRRGGPD